MKPTVGFVRSLEQKILDFIIRYVVTKILNVLFDKSSKVLGPRLQSFIKKLNVRFPLGVGIVTASMLQLLGYLPYTGSLNTSPIAREIWLVVATMGGIFGMLDGIKWRGVSYRGVQLIGPDTRMFGGLLSRQASSHPRASPSGNK